MVFTHGRRFMADEERIRSQDPNHPMPNHVITWLALPMNVLSAFACELFLKTLLILEGQNPSDTHNLKALFKKLHNKTQRRLGETWDKAQAKNADMYDYIERLTGERPLRDLRGALSVCGDAFTNIRYYYEETSRSRYYLTDLPRILHGYILELKPEWEL
jgi:hypothetical protein